EMVVDIARFMEPGDRTVVLATHSMEEVRRLADYVVFLVDGRFLGMYEKDTLLEEWRRVWLEREPVDGTPGIVRVAGERPVEVVSASWRETSSALRSQGIVVERSVPVDLTDILEHLMHDAHGGPTGEEMRSVRMS